MENEILERLGELLELRAFKQIKEILEEHNEVDTAEYLSSISPKDATIIFRVLNKEVAADVFAYLDPDVQQFIVSAMTDTELADVMDELFVDELVDLVEELPASIVQRVLKNVDPSRRATINQFLKYPDNSAGSIMTSELIHLKMDMTVKQAIDRIRNSDIDGEIIYTSYVTDAKRKLLGVVHMKDLLLSDDDTLIEDVMIEDFISTTTLTDKEEVGHLFSKYDLLNIPVTDNEGRLVGVVSIDDAVDVLVEEATEDFELMAAMKPSEKPYMQTGVFTLAKNRLVWLLVLMISATISGTILSKYQLAFAAYPLLVTFMPMLTDTGGNAGSQTSTTIIRGMALSEIELSDFFRVWWKEIRVSILVGAVLAAVNFGRVLLFHPGEFTIALIVSLSLLLTVMIAKSIATMMPMLAKRLGADPALMASPLITTIVDAVSLTIYFTIAQTVLGIGA
ncbi:MAG: magnesium transporter [Eubacteriales bacterium]|nr:magnesium transporter [Eubacteriales bacterium]